MSVTHLLDTSVYSQPLKPHPLPSVLNRWDQLGFERLAVAAICEAEILFGLERKQSPALFRSYQNLLQHRLTVLPFDESAAQQYSKIKVALWRSGKPIGELDLLIAATAKANRLILATLNARHFEAIEGLGIEDWSRE